VRHWARCLGSFPSLYGLKSQPTLVTATSEQIPAAEVSSSLDSYHTPPLRIFALSGANLVGLTMALPGPTPLPIGFQGQLRRLIFGAVDGRVTGSFGERNRPIQR